MASLLLLGSGAIALLLYVTRADSGERFTPEALSEISPFLAAGRYGSGEDAVGFEGELGPAWNYLPTGLRRSATAEIGQYFHARGIRSVVLRGPGRALLAHYMDGQVVALREKPTKR